MFQWARNLLGGGSTKANASLVEARANLVNEAALSIRARYDSSLTTDENKRLWGMTDLFSAKAANSYQVRSTLRRRARYEIANNSYALGIVRSVTDDLIASGPTLQVKTDSAEANRQVERAFGSWAKAVSLTEKLRTLKLAKTADGEGFFVLKTYDAIDDPVKLYPLDIEADQVTTPFAKLGKDFWVDGLTLDDMGNPVSYDVLKVHPGDLFVVTLNPLSADVVPARHIVHWFRKDRPGQVRGIPELTPALDLFAEIRAYRKSVLASARIAAAFSAVLESNSPAGEDPESPGYTPFQSVPIDNGMMSVLPWGLKLSQLRPEQPTTSFDAFTEKLLGEACRCLNVPLNIALGTSQKFNFSSAKLDHINYRNCLSIERGQCEQIVLERLFVAWFDEALMIPGLLPKGIQLETCPHEWHWPGFPALDEAAEAQADTVKRNGGLITDSEYFAKRGYDWRDVYRQLGDEKKEREKFGIVSADSSGKPAEPAKEDDAVEAQSIRAGNFDESKISRDDDGKFGSGGGSSDDIDSDDIDSDDEVDSYASSSHAFGYSPDSAQLSKANSAASEGDTSAVGEALGKLAEAFGEHHTESVAQLKKLGASEKDIAKAAKLVEKKSAEIGKEKSKAERAAGKLKSSVDALAEAEAIPEAVEPEAPDYLDPMDLSEEDAEWLGIPGEPVEPVPKPDIVVRPEPSEPDEPSDEADLDAMTQHAKDFAAWEEDHAAWEKEDAAAEAANAKAQDEYDAAMEKYAAAIDKWSERRDAIVERENNRRDASYEKDVERVEKANEKRQEKIDTAQEKVDDATSAFEEAHGDFESALNDANAEIVAHLEEVEAGVEPKEPADV